MKNRIRLIYLLLFAASVLTACSSDNTVQSGSEGEADIVYQRISGTSALGRPGSWANNCLEQVCAAANAEGFYLLSAEVTASTLMFSDIPEADGCTTRLYSRYRHDAEVSSSLVNFNPSTHAILDAWSMVDQGMSIDQCALDTACASAVMNSFTPDRETAMVTQFSSLMGPIWPDGRNPFSDVYIADANPNSDSYNALDAMHDHFNFMVTESDFLVLDNNGDELSRTNLQQLLVDNPNAITRLTDQQLSDATDLPVPSPPAGNPITLSYQTTPSLANSIEPPLLFEVNASGSSSLNPGELTFTHQLTDPNGFTEQFTGAVVSTTLTEPGSYVWVITVADSANNSLVQGLVIGVSASEDSTPTFGGDGSCLTSAPLTANSLNVCEETQNGGSLGVCEVVSSGSVQLQFSPAPCASEVQNDGAIFGVCTIADSEVRVFFYDNPARPNLTETFEEKQQRTSQLCTDSLEGEWSITP
jgi:hypothetical protein